MLLQKSKRTTHVFKMLKHSVAIVAIAASAAFTAPRSLPMRTAAMKFSAADAELVPRDVLFGNPEYWAGVGINRIVDCGWP